MVEEDSLLMEVLAQVASSWDCVLLVEVDAGCSGLRG